MREMNEKRMDFHRLNYHNMYTLIVNKVSSVWLNNLKLRKIF